jgi:two-component system OmpR family sensor kinase
VNVRSLESHLALLQLGLAACVIAIFACSSVWLSGRTLQRQERLELAATAKRLAASIERERGEEGDLARGAKDAVGEESPIVAEIEVRDSTQHLVYRYGERLVRGKRDGTVQTLVPLSRGASLIARMSTEPRRHAVAALAMALAITAVPLFLVTLAVSRVLARRALRPLSQISRQADRASQNGSVEPLGTTGDPTEVAALAGSFNRLLARLESMIRAERNFTRDAAHELRTPLTVISGELEHAALDRSLPDRQRDSLLRSWAQTRAMSTLVEALLLLRKADDVHRDPIVSALPVNLGDVIREVAADLRREWPDRDRDVDVAAPDEALVAGDPALLAAAARNLLANALKFSAAGAPVRVILVTAPTGCTVIVEDGGPGIPAEDRERIFDPFFRGSEARAAHAGFGLGLPLIRRVARAHGGDVTVGQSTLGGARFELVFPPWLPPSFRSR